MSDFDFSDKAKNLIYQHSSCGWNSDSIASLAGYQSSIELIMGDLEAKMEGDCFQAIQRYGFNINKEELIKALNYDRNQWALGYEYAKKTYEQEWFSADEQLPEDCVTVLIWFEYYRYGDYNRMFRTYGLSYVVDGRWSGFINGETGWKDWKILAWMNLPNPPEEKES